MACRQVKRERARRRARRPKRCRHDTHSKSRRAAGTHHAPTLTLTSSARRKCTPHPCRVIPNLSSAVSDRSGDAAEAQGANLGPAQVHGGQPLLTHNFLMLTPPQDRARQRRHICTRRSQFVCVKCITHVLRAPMRQSSGCLIARGEPGGIEWQGSHREGRRAVRQRRGVRQHTPGLDPARRR